MRKLLLKLLLINFILIPSVLTFAQLGQNGSIKPVFQKKTTIDQQLTPNKSVNSIFEEDFSGGVVPPAGWTIIGDSDANWTWWNGTNAGGEAPECSFGWNPIFTGFSKMVTPEIATSGATTLVLEFQHWVWDFAGEGYTYAIETTSDGGTTWNDVWSISPTGDVPAETVTLVIENEDVGSDNFQFALCFYGSTTQINYWYIDDFILSSEAVETYNVTYTVKDEGDNPVEGASVNMQSGGTLTTNASGEVVFENMLPGEYTWWAAASGLTTEAGNVTVTDTDVSVDVVLTISSVLLEEYFGGGALPDDWSIVGDGQSNWVHTYSGLAADTYPELRFDNVPAFDGESKFVSPEVITLGYTDLYLDFDFFLADASGTDCSIKVKTTSDGGTTWNEVWSETPTGDMGPKHQTILISSDDVGSDMFQFAFTVEGISTDITNWYIDNVILTAALQLDAGIVSIDIPTLLAPGVDMDPSVEVINLGAQTIDFDVTVEFADGGNVYSETITVTDLASLATETIVFPTWNSIAGSFDGEVYVSLIDDENLENDEIIFGIEVASGLVAKMPIYEMFTSSTCPPCVYANEALDALLDENSGEYSLIKYQVNWPGQGDPYYILEAGVRVDYYEVTTVPSLYVNSENFSPAMDITQEDFDAFQDAETALEIEITQATIDDDNMITIESELLSKVNYAAGLSAHIVVVEKLTVENVGSNGETEFHNVMMAMLPDALGETLEEINTDVPVTLIQSYDMDETNMETKDDLAVVVFVQDNTDNSILQSAMIDVTIISGTEDNLLAQGEIKLYPNPASNNLMIESVIDIQKIEMYNQIGQFVKVENTNSKAINLNIAHLESGVYFVKVFSQGSVITKSFIVE